MSLAAIGLPVASASAKPPIVHGRHHHPPSVRLPRAAVLPKHPTKSAKAARHAVTLRKRPARIATSPIKLRRHRRRAATSLSKQLAASLAKSHVVRFAKPLVMIDPGHGGRDSGAVGATGVLEKDVTLATALELQRELRRQGRYRVELTRKTDQTLALSSRVARAWSEHPALFISIHADASPDPKARGASVYVRNQAVAGSTVTKLPVTPAASGAIGRALSSGDPRPSPGSAWLQVAVVEQLKADVAMRHDPAREAHLYVLGAVDVPSVLVEMGFVSNRHEEHLLRTVRYRRTVARAIRDAIRDYFDKVAFAVANKS